MPKKRHLAILDGTLLAILSLFMFEGIVTLGFLENVSKEDRALMILTSGVGIIACFTGFIYISSFKKWLRRKIWLKAMAFWEESYTASAIPNFDSAGLLSEVELKRLAIQVYSRMGYLVISPSNEDEHLKLINPEGKIELVVCKRTPNLIAIHHIHSLQLSLKLTKAVRGFFWAPSGFTRDAIQWAVHRPIVLADGNEIGRLVDCANAKGSWLLEY